MSKTRGLFEHILKEGTGPRRIVSRCEAGPRRSKLNNLYGDSKQRTPRGLSLRKRELENT